MEGDLISRAQQQAALCRVFGNPCRLLILWSLSEGELAVGEIAERVGSSLQNVSQHLRLLRKRKLIAARRDGQHIYYRIEESGWLNKCLIMTSLEGNRPQSEGIAQITGGF